MSFLLYKLHAYNTVSVQGLKELSVSQEISLLLFWGQIFSAPFQFPVPLQSGAKFFVTSILQVCLENTKLEGVTGNLLTVPNTWEIVTS